MTNAALKLDDSFLLADIVVFDLVHIEKNIREAKNIIEPKLKKISKKSYADNFTK